MAIVAQNIGKSFGRSPQPVLQNISYTVADGDFLAISGRSGSGKSTLLYLLSTLDDPTTGSISFDGKNITEADTEELHRLRNEEIGFVIQFHYLLPELTALDNVLMPARKHGISWERRTAALQLFEEFEIADKIHHRPSELSGGEQQRVSIARALIMNPRYIFADELTGDLDSINAKKVMDILQRANQERGATLVLVTHEPEFARLATAEITLFDGRVATERRA